MREWLDKDGSFNFGKYAGESAEDIAKKDPNYIRWILDKAELTDEEREALELYLRFRNY